jgi:transcriptional regulator with XRE-family HTH domain
LGKTSGLPFQYLSKIERGEINTPLETLAIVAKALNVSMAAFFPPTHDSAPEHVLMNESRLRSALERIRTATDDIAVELKRAHHPPKTA